MQMTTVVLGLVVALFALLFLLITSTSLFWRWQLRSPPLGQTGEKINVNSKTFFDSRRFGKPANLRPAPSVVLFKGIGSPASGGVAA